MCCVHWLCVASRPPQHVLWYTGSAYLVFTANSTMLEDPWTPLPQPYSINRRAGPRNEHALC